jgi:microcystin-dependent protein
MENFIGQIITVGFNYAPKGWALCNGQLLAINQNQALFSLLGTTYGGNGQTTFGLPNLQGCVPVGAGSSFTLGSFGGTETVTLQTTQIPSHNHAITVSSGTGGTLTTPQGNTVGAQASPAYAASPDSFMAANTLANAGSTQGHENRAPYVTVNYVIALQGIFPSRN